MAASIAASILIGIGCSAAAVRTPTTPGSYPTHSLSSAHSLFAGRRAALSLGPALALLTARPAAASYAMQQAAVQSQSWQATGKEKERAVYRAIEEDIDSKRRFREEAGDLGYVGGEYTKRSAASRASYDRQAEESRPQGSYTRPEELVTAGTARAVSRRVNSL